MKSKINSNTKNAKDFLKTEKLELWPKDEENAEFCGICFESVKYARKGDRHWYDLKLELQGRRKVFKTLNKALVHFVDNTYDDQYNARTYNGSGKVQLSYSKWDIKDLYELLQDFIKDNNNEFDGKNFSDFEIVTYDTGRRGLGVESRKIVISKIKK